METADCYHVNGAGFDGYGGFRSCSTHEMEALLMLCGNGTSSDMKEYEDKFVKKEYQIQRQSSSPAQFFSDQGLDNGFKGEHTYTSRLYSNHISFSSNPSSYSNPMPQLAQVENQSLGNNNGGNGHFSPNLFSGLSKLQTRTGDCRDKDYSIGLTHHLSLSKTYDETDAVETFWQFRGSVPCKIRAKRGCATHPRSIAERERRMRISERMRKLQGLFPNIDKQTTTADMLEMAVDYIKDLQRQVKTLREAKAKCSC